MNQQNGPSGASDEDFKRYIRSVPDFPKQGILFYDITNLLKDGEAFRRTIDRFTDEFCTRNVDVVCSIEARGFILGAAVAYRLGAGFVPIRKAGKLPWECYQGSYDLEYGQDSLEVHTDAIAPGHRVLLVDDVIATGGTVEAARGLISKMRGELVCAAFLLELVELGGRERLKDLPVFSLMKY
jgi:adenine phosphoribosyltransferase